LRCRAPDGPRHGFQETAFTTAPDLRQRVQTFMRRRVPAVTTRILWMFGRQTRDETLCAWLIWLP
jgi:hypothetical protein